VVAETRRVIGRDGVADGHRSGGEGVLIGSGAESKASLSAASVADAIEIGTGPILVDLTIGEADVRDDDGRGDATADEAEPERGSAVAAASRWSVGPSVEAVREALLSRAEDLFRVAFGAPVRPGAGD